MLGDGLGGVKENGLREEKSGLTARPERRSPSLASSLLSECYRPMSGRLFVVATPLGNLHDLSPRALETLRACALVACEDTRRTGALLRAHDIRTPMTSFFEHNER